MPVYLWLPVLTIVIGGGSGICYLLFVRRPVRLDPRAKVSEGWLADHNGGPYTGGK